MKRRIRSPKGARGAASTGTRGGRGRGRARGGAKGRSGRGGGKGKPMDSNDTGNSSPSTSDCVNIILKDNHHRSASNHFSRVPNGSVSYGREPVLQLGSIPRRPFMGPAQHNGNNNYNNNNNNNVNNNGGNGNDFYLHKKFKKVTATVDPVPSTSNSEASANIGGAGSSNSLPEAASSNSGVNSASANCSSSTVGMVYKPKFRIKSEMEAAQAAQEPPSSPSSKPLMALLSPREKASPATATSAPEPLSPKPMTSFQSTCSDVASDIHARVSSITSSGGSNVIVNSSSLLVSNKNVVSPCSSSKSSSSNHSSGHPAKLTKEKRLDRKSLDDRISKIIDENQSILEWPEQFTKMLKNHTSRGQSNHQRTSHLLSGGCTTELPASSPSSSNLLSHHQQPNGILRHSSTSSEMSTSGGSVELLPATPSHHHHSLLNSNGLGSNRSGPEAFTFRHSLSNPEIHDFSLSSSLSSVPAPTDLSFGAHGGSSTVTTIVRPSSASSTGSASSSTTTSSMVPKKRRRLSPTPSRLCGGEVSELPVNQPAAGNKNYFQDVDMTVRVSNCGPSGAKVTIRTNNNSVSGGSIQSSGGIMAPVDFTKIIDTVPSPHAISKPANGAIFFPGPGPSTPSTILAGNNKPLSLVTKHKTKCDVPGSGMSPKGGSLLVTNSGIESHKPEKGSRGRPPRKKSVPESTAAECTASMSSGASLLCLVQPPSEIPSRPDSSDSTVSPLHRSPPTSFQNMFASSAMSLLTTSVTQNKFASHSNTSEVNTMSPLNLHRDRSAYNDNAVQSETEQSRPSKSTLGSPTLKSENFSPETPFQVVPTPTQNPKRPTFLALKPVNTNSKKTEPGVLPSPETPRVAKPYNQMTINGQAYTYLGFKVSTRSSYTCLFKTQPMFIPQETDPKLSMYTNWQPRPRDPNLLQIGISTNDSRVNGRKSPHNILYTSAYGNNCDTLTVSSPGNQLPISSPICETKTFLSGIETKVSSSVSQSISPVPSTSTSRTELTQPINIQVSPTPSSGIVPISPPSDSSSSPVSFVSSNNLAVGSGGLMSIAAFSPKPVTVNLSSRDSKRGRCTPPAAMSSSDTNSQDESSNGFRRRRSMLKGHDDDGESSPSEGPLALTGSRDDGNEDSLSARYESNRVKIMEGGFESNEDYTYVRGRGRGRYVCEACGIRCKKPSMLRKHLKTHTDLRPYTCKLCNFSFKTKGNLTKHQKSKSHLKKCAGLGIHPESSTSLAMTGPAFSISDTNTSDNDSDDDFDGDNETDSQDECDDGDSVDGMDGNDNGSESFEKEIAQSLLDLSKGTVRLPSGGSASSDYESSNDAKVRGRQPSFPYTSMIEDISNSSAGSYTGDSIPVPETAIDLRVSRSTSDKRSMEPADLPQTENDNKKIKIEKNGLIKAVGVVKEAEAWEPAVDEGSRCLNLKRVLNNTESDHKRTPDSRIPPEVKTEVLEVSPSSCEVVYGPRQRTESETSNCSATSNSFVTRPPIAHSVEVSNVTGKRLSSVTPPPQSQMASASGSSVKLHQPWLSPKEAREKKELDAKSAVSPVDLRPVNVSVDVAPSFKPVEEVEIPPRDIPITLPSSSTAPPPPVIESGIGGVSSPTPKVFSGLPALKPQAEFRQPSGAQALVKDEGKAECNVCGKAFSRASQLTLHMNIHYIERPFRCDPCGVSFRTKGHLIKHRRSSSHDCKVYLTEAWGVANEENPRPFKCPDCKIAFRIHGHLAKHLRSKMHIMRMECLGKLPFGIYFEMEKSGINLNEIDTTDCDMSLVSLQNVARKIYGEQWKDRLTVPVEEPPI